MKVLFLAVIVSVVFLEATNIKVDMEKVAMNTKSMFENTSYASKNIVKA